jgi:Uma2 family endonuclease
LKGTGCVVLGPDAGVPTIGRAVRYPDALVTCAAGPGSDLLIAGVVLVIEVLSPTSERTDRIEKVREYFAVPSIRRYVLLEQTSAGATVFEKQDGASEWTAGVAIAGETLRLPELGIEIPIDEFYEGVALADAPTGSGEAA